jgi:hypothetical protein
VGNEEVLHRANGDRNMLHTIKGRKAGCFGHILRSNCLLIHVIKGKVEGRIEVKGRRGRRRKQLLATLRKSEDTGNWKRKHYIAL